MLIYSFRLITWSKKIGEALKNQLNSHITIFTKYMDQTAHGFISQEDIITVCEGVSSNFYLHLKNRTFSKFFYQLLLFACRPYWITQSILVRVILVFPPFIHLFTEFSLSSVHLDMSCFLHILRLRYQLCPFRAFSMTCKPQCFSSSLVLRR